MPFRLLLRALPVAWLAVAPSALAAEPPPASLPVALEVEGCESLDERELFELLIVEFKTLGVMASARPERLKVECRGTRALVTLRSASAESAELAIKLDMAATMPAARSRLLALAISELVVEGRSREVEPQPARTEEPRSLPTESHAVAPTPTERRLDPAIVAAASVRYVAGPATWLVGAALGAELPLSGVFCAGFDARAESGSTGTPLANVGWTSFSAGAVLLAGGRFRRLGWGAGPGFRSGYLRLAATPTVPDARGASVGGLWTGPVLAARARYDVADRAYVHAGFEAGWTIASLTGNVSDGRPLLDVSGGWALVTGGMGLAF